MLLKSYMLWELVLESNFSLIIQKFLFNKLLKFNKLQNSADRNLTLLNSQADTIITHMFSW